MGEKPEGEPGEAPEEFDRGNFDFESLAGETLTLDDYMTYTQALSDGDSYYYTMSASLNASGDLVPYGEEETEESEETEQTQENTQGQPGGPGGEGMGGPMGQMGGFSPQGDFSITGFSSYDAMMSLFGEDGTIADCRKLRHGPLPDAESAGRRRYGRRKNGTPG